MIPTSQLLASDTGVRESRQGPRRGEYVPVKRNNAKGKIPNLETAYPSDHQHSPPILATRIANSLVPVCSREASPYRVARAPIDHTSQSLPQSDSTTPDSVNSCTILTVGTQLNRSQPISIPAKPIGRRDPNHIHTPLSARGDRKGAFFPFAITPAPAEHTCVPSPNVLSPARALFNPGFDHCRRRRSSSSSLSGRSIFELTMHTEQIAGRYTPSSPLSPRLLPNHQPLSPQQPRQRAIHSRQISRSNNSNLGRYHPANSLQQDVSTEVQQPSSPSMPRQRPPVSLEMMRERQRELIDRARMSSKIAASPMGVKPGAPRLDPLSSPKGPMTPLALEEAQDYFSVVTSRRSSPARSTTPRADDFKRDVDDHESEPMGKSKLEQMA